MKIEKCRISARIIPKSETTIQNLIFDKYFLPLYTKNNTLILREI